MTKIYVETSYSVCTGELIELPDAYTWDDVKDYWVKYGVFYATFKDGTNFECDMGTDIEIDYKRPDMVSVYDPKFNPLDVS